MITKQEANNLAKNTAFVNLAKNLYLNPDSMTPSSIVSLLSMTGLKIPKSVAIGVDFAQLYIAGGAIASDIQTGASIGSFFMPSALAVSAGVGILEQAGLMDPKSPAAQILTLGTDAAFIISSCGTNVLADIKGVMDLCSALQGPNVSAAATMAAKQGLISYMQNREKTQVDAFSKHFADFQSGKLTALDLMTLTADESPDLFYNYYPQMKTFIPPVKMILTSTATVSGKNAFGQGKSASDTESYTFTTAGFGPTMNTSDIWNAFVVPVLDRYRYLDARAKERMCFKMNTLAALSMIPPFIETFDFNWNPFPTMQNYGLTFSDLGESDVIPDFVDLAVGVRAPPVVVINGQPVSDPVQKQAYLDAQATQTNYNQTHENLLKYDQEGNFPLMMKYMDQRSYNTIKENAAPVWTDLSGDPRVIQAQMDDSANARNIRNFWSAIHLWETIKGKPWYQSAYYEGEYDFLPTSQSLNQTVKDLTFKIHMRGLNKMAIKKVASILGTSPNKIYLREKIQPGKPTVIGIKE